MSPEQLMGLPADGRADLWASGVILYELITGASPFLAETPATVMHNVLQAEPRKPTEINPSLPAGFDNIVARALAKKADERFQTAREFQATLVQALQGKAVSATASARAPASTAARRAPAISLSPESLEEIERSLSRHIGPLAKVIVKRTQGEATTMEDFFRALAENIPNEAEQAAFMQKMKTVKVAHAPAPAADAQATLVTSKAPAQMAFSPDVLSSAEKALASYVGPLARVLIKDAASKSGNIKELYAQLASHIDSEDERRAFLATLGR
jgi:serine/threonine protein kinase